MNIKQAIKRVIVPQDPHKYRLRGGLAKGMIMQLNLMYQTQQFLGLQERELFRPLRSFLPDWSGSIVDVGASEGYYTLAFLKTNAKRVIACEPNHESVKRLLFNIEANDYQTDSRFCLIQEFIGKGENKLGLFQIIKDLPRPILVKVDIEGGEYDLLESLIPYAYLSDVHWVIETHSAVLEKRCIEWLQSNRYEIQIIPNAYWRKIIPENRAAEHNRWLLAKPKKL